MHVEQITLPLSLEGDEVHRAPYMCDKQAFGFKGKVYIEYYCPEYDGGMSDESGEMLHSAYINKLEQYQPEGSAYATIAGPQLFSIMRVFISESGEVYRTWKGKLKGRPICNIFTGKIYSYVKASDKNMRC